MSSKQNIEKNSSVECNEAFPSSAFELVWGFTFSFCMAIWFKYPGCCRTKNNLNLYVATPIEQFTKEGYSIDIKMNFKDPVNNDYQQDCRISIRQEDLHISNADSPTLLNT